MNRGGCFEFYFIFEPLLPIKELYFPELNSSEQLACDLHGFSYYRSISDDCVYLSHFNLKMDYFVKVHILIFHLVV